MKQKSLRLLIFITLCVSLISAGPGLAGIIPTGQAGGVSALVAPSPLEPPSWVRWPYASPITTGGSLRAAAYYDAANAYAVGHDEDVFGNLQAFALRWDGNSWTRMAVPTGVEAFESISVLGPNEFFAGGFSVAAHWDGQNWTTYNLTKILVYAISMSSPNEGWAFGQSANFYHFMNGTWETVTGITNAYIYTADTLAADDVWVAGEYGEIWHWDGTTWTRTPTPVYQAMYGLSMLSPTDGWAVGAGGTVLHWNGITWDLLPITGAGDLRSVKMISSTEGWIVSALGATYHWDGQAWTKVNSPTSNALYSVAAASPYQAVAVGDKGTLIQWDRRSWSVVDLNAGRPNSFLKSVSMADAGFGWAVGSAALAFKFEDGSWTSLPPLGKDIMLYSVKTLSRQEAFAAGAQGKIFHFANNAWTEMDNPDANLTLFGVDAISSTLAFAVGGGANMGLIEKWDGQTWTPVEGLYPDNPLTAIHFIAPNDGWAIGAASNFYHWDGKTWTEEDAPEDGLVFNAMDFSSPQEGWAVGYGGVIARWHGGEWSVWGEIPEVVRLHSVVVVSSNDAWAGGENGNLLHWDGTDWKIVASPTLNRLTGLASDHAGGLWGVGQWSTFIKYTPTFAITGKVQDLSGNPQSGFEINNSAGASTLTDASGAYTFTGVISGATYIISPLTADTLYAPVTRTVSGPSDAAGVDFIANRAGWKCWPETDAMSCLDDLSSVQILSSQDGWAVGHDGSILRWDGLEWRHFPTPTQEWIFRLSMSSPQDGWAVGSNGLLLNWNGLNWKVMPSTLGIPYFGVAALSAHDVWVGGKEGTILHWDGNDWQTVESNTQVDITAFSFLSPTDGYAVGGVFSPLGLPSSVILHWNGTAWQPMYNPVSLFLVNVKMLSPSDGWAMGAQGALLRWNGSVWALQTGAIPADHHLYGMEFLAPNDGWMVGMTSGGTGGGAAGVAYHWDGNTWQAATLPRSGGLWAISRIPDSSELWAVGDDATLLHKLPGSDWQAVQQVPSRPDFYRVSVLSGQDAWMIASNGHGVHRWDGSTWNPVAGGEEDKWFSVKAYTGNDVWFGGLQGEITHWDGSSFMTTTTPGDKVPIYALAITGAQEGWAVGGTLVHTNTMQLMACPDAQVCQNAGNTSIYPAGLPAWFWQLPEEQPAQPQEDVYAPLLWRWDGTRWNNVSVSRQEILTCLDVVAPNDIWVGGTHGILLHWNGSAWEEKFSGFSDETILSISHVNADDLWGVGSQGLAMHGQRDQSSGEIVWTFLYDKFSEFNLEKVQMLPNGQGWSIGTAGGIFFYNGAAWNRAYLPIGYDLFDIDMNPQAPNSDGWLVARSKAVLRFSPSFDISGQVVNSAGKVQAGVRLQNNGGRAVTTDSKGAYRFAALHSGSYQVLPRQSGVQFTPATQTVTLGPDISGIDFVMSLLKQFTYLPFLVR